MYTGIQGPANIDKCAIGAAHSLQTYNFLSEVFFVVVFLTLLLVVLILTRLLKQVGTLLYHSVTVLLIVSIVMGIGDIVYSLYVASQVYRQFDEFQQGQINCSSSVYYSSFVAGIFADIGLVVLVCLWIICDFRDIQLFAV